MTKIIFATLCSTLFAASTLHAAAAPSRQHKITNQAPVLTSNVRNARAAIDAPTYDYSDTARGNAEAAPAGR